MEDNNYTKILESQNEILREKIEEHETVRDILANKIRVRAIDDFLTSMAHNDTKGEVILLNNTYLSQKDYELLQKYLSIGDSVKGKTSKEIFDMHRENRS